MTPLDSRSTIVYTRKDCCLCDVAIATLRNHGLRPQLFDVDDDPALRAKFTDWVPVVEIDGQIRFRGQVNPTLLRRLLASPPEANPGRDE